MDLHVDAAQRCADAADAAALDAFNRHVKLTRRGSPGESLWCTQRNCARELVGGNPMQDFGARFRTTDTRSPSRRQ
jgi:hypothetical protein